MTKKERNWRIKLIATVLGVFGLVVLSIDFLNDAVSSRLTAQVEVPGNTVEDDGSGDGVVDDGSTDSGGESYCKTYENGNQQCEECFDEQGTKTSEKCWEKDTGDKDGNTDSTDGDSTGGSCETYQSGGQDCEVCYDNQGNKTQEECWTTDEWKDDWNSDTADSKEVEKQKKDMEKNYFKNRQERELKKLDKKLARTEKHLERVIKQLEKEKKQALKNEWPIDIYDELIQELENTIAEANIHALEIEKVEKWYETDSESLKSTWSSLTPGVSTWKDLENTWSYLRKLDIYWGLRDALDIKVMVLERVEQTTDLRKEIAKLHFELGENISPEIEENLNGILLMVDSCGGGWKDIDEVYNSVLAEAETVRSLTDPQEIRDAVDDFWFVVEDVQDIRETKDEACEDLWYEDPWMTIENARKMTQVLKFMEDVNRETEMISQELTGAGIVISAIKDLGIEKEDVKKALENLDELVAKATDVLVEMKELLEKIVFEETSDYEPWELEEMMREFWNVLDGVGMAAEKNMGVIFKYFDNHPEDFEKLSEDLKEISNQWIYKGVRGGPKDYKGELGAAYGEIDEEFIEKMVKKIEGDVMEEVMRRVSAELMEKLAPYLDKDAVAEILNSIDVFGDKGNELLSNTVEVYEQIDEVDVDKLGGTLKELAEKTANTLIVPSEAENLKSLWSEVAVTEDKDTLKGLTTQIEESLTKNEELSVKGEEAYKFYDVEGSEWYYKSVMEMKEEGVVSGYSGDRAGNYGPADPVTIAETLKMALEASDKSVVPQGGDEKTHWAVKAGYVKTAEEMGLGNLVNIEDINRAASREEVAVIISEVFGFTTNEDEHPFSDYSGNFGEQITGVYNAGVFTGEGDTGNFNGSAQINRASMAKVIKYAEDAAGVENFVYELKEFDADTLLEEIKSRGEGKPELSEPSTDNNYKDINTDDDMDDDDDTDLDTDTGDDDNNFDVINMLEGMIENSGSIG